MEVAVNRHLGQTEKSLQRDDEENSSIASVTELRVRGIGVLGFSQQTL
jgi:hypothetical protein